MQAYQDEHILFLRVLFFCQAVSIVLIKKKTVRYWNEAVAVLRLLLLAVEAAPLVLPSQPLSLVAAHSLPLLSTFALFVDPMPAADDILPVLSLTFLFEEEGSGRIDIPLDWKRRSAQKQFLTFHVLPTVVPVPGQPAAGR